MNYYIQLGALWILYYFVHSLFATDSIKFFIKKVSINLYQFYRLIYTLVSTVGLILIILFTIYKQEYIFKPMNAFLVSGIAILMLGLMIIKLSFKQYRLRSFIGIEVEGNEFIRSGILECVRHPLYTATILIIVAFFLILPTKSILLVNLLTFIYLVIGIFLEERKLTIQYGAKYLRYKEEVPSIIPKFKCLSFQKTSKN